MIFKSLSLSLWLVLFGGSITCIFFSLFSFFPVYIKPQSLSIYQSKILVCVRISSNQVIWTWFWCFITQKVFLFLSFFLFVIVVLFGYWMWFLICSLWVYFAQIWCGLQLLVWCVVCFSFVFLFLHLWNFRFSITRRNISNGFKWANHKIPSKPFSIAKFQVFSGNVWCRWLCGNSVYLACDLMLLTFVVCLVTLLVLY